VFFSPDRQWLVVSTAQGYQFYQVGSWEPRHAVELPLARGRAMALSADGWIAALCDNRDRVVRLVDPRTGQKLATLDITNGPVTVGQMAFSPDGSQLVIVYVREGLRVWDLRKVRARLAAMGLDWDAPPYPPAGPAAAPVQLEVDPGAFAGRDHRDRSLGHLKAGRWQPALDEANQAIGLFANDVAAWRLRAEARLGLKEYEQALADYRHSRTLGPPNSRAENMLAWRLVVAPGAGADLVAQAVEWARTATSLAPERGSYWNTLGVAHYRAGDWNKAIEALNTSIKLQSGREYAHDAFFMAMAYWKRGEVDRGREWLSKARDWMEKHNPDDAELRGFDAEARACSREALRQELERLSRSVERDPKNTQGYLQRAFEYRDLGQHEQALDDVG
jgi:tetratricopeptide (TPR) repeat protein